MKTLIALICRHGETELNAGDCFRGWLDVPLDDNGEHQARATATFLKQNYDVKHVFASPLFRAVTTAKMFASAADLPVAQDRGLLPWHVGAFSGQPKKQYMPALKLFVHNPEVAMPNGESLQDFEDRAYAFYREKFQNADKLGLMAFFAHTSNVTVLENLINGERAGEPESGETVKPGGICAIYRDGAKYSVEPVFGKAEPANYGS